MLSGRAISHDSSTKTYKLLDSIKYQLLQQNTRDGANEDWISSRMSLLHIANLTTIGTKGRSIMYTKERALWNIKALMYFLLQRDMLNSKVCWSPRTSYVGNCTFHIKLRQAGADPCLSV